MEEQCKGITKSGNRCKIKRGLTNGYCRVHRERDTDKRKKAVDEEKRESHERKERDITDVADDVKNGLSAIVLLFTAFVSIIIYMFFKRGTKRKKKK